jgi:hypothetical protein
LLDRGWGAGRLRVTARPITPAGLVEELADRIVRIETTYVRVALDGAPAASPERLAAALVDPLRVRGRPAHWVSMDGFLRPASVRLERGRTDPDAYYEGWWDLDGLRREVLYRVTDSGQFLPSLWDAETDRATRASYVTLPAGGVLLVSGAFLLGAGLPFEYTVHLALSPAALRRRTPDDQQWTLPAYQRYADEAAPAILADVVVRVDDPQHPAVVDSS